MEWRRGDFLLSTDPSLVDIKAVNKAFASDAMPWAAELPEDLLRTAINSCLCLGLYHQPKTENTSGTANYKRFPNPALTRYPTEDAPRRMVGLARVVTDFVTFCYLTDVYILQEYQGQGLAKWMLGCLSEQIDQWPYLRRLLLVTITPRAAELYRKAMGVIEWDEGPSAKLILLERRWKSPRV